MNYLTTAGYRAVLFENLARRGNTRDDIARFWAVAKDDPERSGPMYEALNHWRFSYPSELAAQGCRQSEVQKAHEEALRQAGRSADAIVEQLSHLEELEAEKRQVELQRMDRQMEKILAEGATPSD